MRLRTVWTRSSLSCLLLLPLLAPAALADQPEWLVGTWRHQQDELEISMELVLSADGKARTVLAVAGEKNVQYGTWAYQDRVLQLKDQSGLAMDYPCKQLSDDAMRLTNPMMGMDMVFERTASAPGSDGPDAAGPGSLVGKWKLDRDFMSGEVAFLPDGRYFSVIEVGGEPLSERGAYEVEGNQLALRPTGSPGTTFDATRRGNRLILTADHMEVTLEYELIPGSEASVIEEARQWDAQKAKEDAEWEKRFPTAPLTEQPPHVAVGELPQDPNVEHVFDEAIVFTHPQIYMWFVLEQVEYRNMQGEPVIDRNSQKLFLQPTGRFFYKSTMHYPAQRRAEVSTSWGRYTISENGKLALETDDGETLEAELIDGRRNLLWDDTIFGNVIWEQESLRQAEDG